MVGVSGPVVVTAETLRTSVAASNVAETVASEDDDEYPVLLPVMHQARMPKLASAGASVNDLKLRLSRRKQAGGGVANVSEV